MLNSSLFWEIVIIISSVIELWGCKKIFDYTSEKEASKIRINVIMTFILIFMLFLLKINVSPNSRIIISIVLTFAFYIINYNSNFYTGIVITLIYWMILLGIDALSMSIVTWINSIHNISNLLINNFYRLQSIILGKSILIFNIWLYKIIKDEIQVNKKDILYIGIPIIGNIVSFFIVFKYLFKFSQRDLINDFQMLNFSILLFLSNISIILVIRKIRLDSKLLAEYKVMKKNMDMQCRYYMNIKENQVKTRQLYHDMKNHIICIKKLNENGYDANNYIENIESKVKSYDNTFETGNILLDIILNDKKETCDKNNIDFYCNINFTKCNFIELEDICSIFSNILDNSIEACEKINNEKKYISLEGKIIESFFVLKAENTKVNKINIKNKKVLTDKKDAFLHGLGIKSIESSVKQYNGEIVIDYTDDRFILKILIPVVLHND
jgi:hypothetical protein